MNKRVMKRTRPATLVRQPRVKMLEPEIAVFDTNFNLTSSQAGAGVAFTDIGQGTTYNTRKGTVIHPLSLRIRAFLLNAGGAATMRIVVFRLLYDEETFSSSDLLTTISSAYVVTSAYNREFVGQSPRDRRLEVLHDSLIGSSTDWHVRVPINISIPLKNDLVRYVSDDATDFPVYGALLLFVFTDVVSSSPQITGTGRVEYLDA